MRTRRTLTCTNALSCKGSFIEQKICSTESCPDLSTLKADVATLKTAGKGLNKYILEKFKIKRVILHILEYYIDV